jgi:hypothetical protein
MSTAAKAGPIQTATRRELRGLPVDLRTGTLATTALLLARRLDAGLPAREVSGVARELRQSMTALMEQAPAKPQGDLVDELRARRAERAG